MYVALVELIVLIWLWLDCLVVHLRCSVNCAINYSYTSRPTSSLETRKRRVADALFLSGSRASCWTGIGNSFHITAHLVVVLLLGCILFVGAMSLFKIAYKDLGEIWQGCSPSKYA